VDGAETCIIESRGWFRLTPLLDAPSFNGRTADSGSAYRGSNPWGAAKSHQQIARSRIQLVSRGCRGGCISLRSRFGVEPIHAGDIRAGNKMAISIDRDLNRAVPH